MIKISFTESVHSQITLLLAGKPLEAFDRFFAPDGVMYANDKIFANGAAEGRKKQEPFILAAVSIQGAVEDLIIIKDQEICAFRNRTSFTTSDDLQHKIDGLCWQRWRDGQIIEERYFDGEHMQSVVSAGILQKPDVIKPIE